MAEKVTVDVFCKHYGNPDKGYTYQEALVKRSKVNDTYGVSFPRSKWNGAIIEKDPSKKTGYRVVIKRKEE